MTESNGSPIGPTVGAGLGAVGGAGYNFDPDQIAALIPKWEALKDEIDADLATLQVASNHVQPPSSDQPAVTNARATAQSIDAAIQHSLTLRQYAESWIEQLQRANGTYVQYEDDTSGVLNGRGLYQ